AVLLFVFSVATTSPGKKGTAGPSETSTTKDKAADFDKAAPANNNANPFGGNNALKPSGQAPPTTPAQKPK
ncbi:MAG TPA: hypothetical protein VFJ43_05050, partial [Bacteroidia bacterium]|nr:hypothetical protein [Bacteroidia bacterium]